MAFGEDSGERFLRRQLSYVSSGSEHSGEEDDSPCLSELVHGFLEDGFDSDSLAGGWDSDSEEIDSAAEFKFGAAEEVSRLVARCSESDSYRNMLLSHVLKAIEINAPFRSQQTSVFRRRVASFLRDQGYNAAICKTRWTAASGSIAGNYEFIDVVLHPAKTAESVRYFIDVDFASEFGIARPTREYARLLQSLPVVFVGKGEDLKRIVRSASEAAKRSLKSGGLSIPPWRKHRYLQNKWFGPYKRTTNEDAVNCRSIGIEDAVNVANCRLFGIDTAVSYRPFVRTR